MSLQRKAIRAAVVAALVGDPGNPPTAAGTNISTNRGRPHWEAELAPVAITVFTLSEQSEKSLESPRQFLRTVRVAVEVFLLERSTEVIDDFIDDVCEQLERPLLADPTLGGCAEDLLLSDVQVDIDEMGRQLEGDVRVVFDVSYRYDVFEGSPANVADFLLAHSDWDVAPDTNQVREATDDTVLPQT